MRVFLFGMSEREGMRFICCFGKLDIVIDFFKANPVCAILLVLGILALYISYIGAPRASRKSGHYVSGVPLTGGFLITLAFLLSSVKWLALLGLIDPLLLAVMGIIYDHRQGKDKE